MDRLTRAITIACRAHEHQKDKAGEPYILHPLRVMMNFQDESERVVAVLHDVVEDSSLDLSHLKEQGFGPEIVGAVDALTRREGETYEAFLGRLSGNALAVKVKKADIRDNLDVTRLSDLGEKDLDRIRKYHDALSFLEKKGRGKKKT